MKLIFQVKGQDFTLEQIEDIVEQYLLQKGENPSKRTTYTQQQPSMNSPTPIPMPESGVPYPVDPSKLDWTLFQKERPDERQENTRKFILQARDEIDKNPERYGKPFKTMMTEKTWNWKTVGELEYIATNLGDHMADWIEQAIEWAQRIQNGETWEDVCNKRDTANWYRLVQWKNGYYWLVGGSHNDYDDIPASYIRSCNYLTNLEIYYTVPLVVLYK